MRLPQLSDMHESLLGSVVSCTAMALAVPLLFWSFETHVTVHQLWIHYLYSVVYSNCIGNLFFFAVPRVWMGSARLPGVVKWSARALMVLVGTTVGCLLANVIFLAIFGRNYDFRTEFFGSFKIALILSTAAVGLVTTFETYRFRLQATATELKTKELERERALNLATQMRLASLQSRVHPHFLFNTINSISSLVHDDPQRAEDMLARMAALLRFSLDSAQPGLVSVERELSIVRDYLEIEKARFGERLRYELCGETPPGEGEVLVPPLSIQTLVENSIKYAVNARREGAVIRVLMKMGEGECVVEVQDDGPGFGNLTLVPGHGLDNLEERLAMLFGEGGNLHINSTGKETSVSFTVPCRRARKSGEHESVTRLSGGR